MKVAGRKIRIKQRLETEFLVWFIKSKMRHLPEYTLWNISCVSPISKSRMPFVRFKPWNKSATRMWFLWQTLNSFAINVTSYTCSSWPNTSLSTDRAAKKRTLSGFVKWLPPLSFSTREAWFRLDLKTDNVLLTATEDAKLADFGLAREFIALTQIEEYGGDGPWVTSYERYYMTSGTGPIPWVALGVFDGHYPQKADVFSLGTLFFAILEQDSIMFMEKAIFVAFKNVPGEGKVGIGLAMHLDPNTTIQFSSRAQGSNPLQRIALDALQYNKNDRPSAAEIHNRITNIQGNIKLSRSGNQQPSPWVRGCC